jgi:hypothetical protein
MDEPIFESKYLTSKIKVFKDRVEWKMLFKKNTIPVNQIASVESSDPLKTVVTIETTGGKRFDIPVGMKKKELLQQAINNARAKS